MRIRSAIVVGSFAAASGAYPQLSIPPEAGKGANSKWHLPPRIRPRAGASNGPTAAREPPPAPARRAPRENRPHSTAGFSAVAGSDAVAPKKNVKDGFFEWQTKLMDDLASKYAKTDDAAAPATTAAKASSSSSSSSDDSSSDEVVEKKPLGTRLKNVAGRLAFWRK